MECSDCLCWKHNLSLFASFCELYKKIYTLESCAEPRKPTNQSTSFAAQSNTTCSLSDGFTFLFGPDNTGLLVLLQNVSTSLSAGAFFRNASCLQSGNKPEQDQGCLISNAAYNVLHGRSRNHSKRPPHNAAGHSSGPRPKELNEDLRGLFPARLSWSSQHLDQG